MSAEYSSALTFKHFPKVFKIQTIITKFLPTRKIRRNNIVFQANIFTSGMTTHSNTIFVRMFVCPTEPILLIQGLVQAVFFPEIRLKTIVEYFDPVKIRNFL